MGLSTNPGVIESASGQRTMMLLGDHRDPQPSGGLLLPGKDMEEDSS